MMERAALNISVIIPLLNGARFISQALDSLFAQTIAFSEVIIVDGGSCDDGPAIVQRYAADKSVIFLQAPAGKPNAARNFAIKRSTGDLIALLEQNDIWYPDHLAILSDPFLQDTGKTLGWSCSDVDEIAEDGRLIRRCVQAGTGQGGPKLDLERCLSDGMGTLPSACLLRRAAIVAVGGVDERLSSFQIDDLLLRLFLRGYGNVYAGQASARWRNVFLQPGNCGVCGRATK